jgi:hypothetical protein
MGEDKTTVEIFRMFRAYEAEDEDKIKRMSKDFGPILLMLRQSTLIQDSAHVQQSIFAHALCNHEFTFVDGTSFFFFFLYMKSQNMANKRATFGSDPHK